MQDIQGTVVSNSELKTEWEEMVISSAEPPGVKYVLLVLAALSGKCRFTKGTYVKTIADYCGLSKQTIQKRMQTIKKTGFVKIIKKPKSPNYYFLIIPGWWSK